MSNKSDAQVWAQFVGGTTTFGTLPIGASFCFPRSEDVVYTKLNARRYTGKDRLRTYTTRSHTAVKEVK
jgi:hypothetical protein